MKIVIYVKTVDEATGQHKDITISNLKRGKKHYDYLIKQWKRYRAVSLPLYNIAINSDEIYAITLEN